MADSQSKGFILKYGSLILSAMALCISGYTFWKTQLYDPELSFTTGESVTIGHFNEGNAQLILPVVAVNPGNQSQVVDRFALRVTPPAGAQTYLFEPYYYQKVDEEGDFETESNPDPVLVEGKGMELRYVLFRSSVSNPFRFASPGIYKGELLSWTRGANEPATSDLFDFRLDSMSVAGVANNSGVSRVPLRKYEAWTAGPVSK